MILRCVPFPIVAFPIPPFRSLSDPLSDRLRRGRGRGGGTFAVARGQRVRPGPGEVPLPKTAKTERITRGTRASSSVFQSSSSYWRFHSGWGQYELTLIL